MQFNPSGASSASNTTLPGALCSMNQPGSCGDDVGEKLRQVFGFVKLCPAKSVPTKVIQMRSRTQCRVAAL